MNRRTIFTLFIVLYLSSNLFSHDYQKLLNIRNKDIKELEMEAKKLERGIKKNKNNAELNAELGFYYYNLAINEKPVAAKAVKYLEKSFELKEDFLIKGMLGLSYTLRAGEEQNLGYLNGGFKILDEACDENKDVFIKMILLSLRIGQNLEIPEFIYPRRIEIIKKDIVEMEKLFKEGNLSVFKYVYIQFDKYRFLLKERNKKAAEEIKNYIKTNYPDHPVNLEFSKINENGEYEDED